MRPSIPNASWNNAYAGIRRALEGYGFDRRQGSFYFGDENVTAVTCVLTIQDLTRSFPRFATCVRHSYPADREKQRPAVGNRQCANLGFAARRQPSAKKRNTNGSLVERPLSCGVAAHGRFRLSPNVRFGAAPAARQYDRGLTLCVQNRVHTPSPKRGACLQGRKRAAWERKTRL